MRAHRATRQPRLPVSPGPAVDPSRPGGGGDATGSGPRPLAVTGAVGFVLLVVLALLFAPAGAQQPKPAAAAPKVVPGVVVAAELAAGQVSAIEANGRSTVLIKDLKNPNGVAVLADGTVLVADSGNNRIMGIGGRLGDAPVEVAKDLPFPEGLAVAPDGTVFVTLFQKGEVGRVDLATGAYTKIAGDLKGPGDLIVRDGTLYIPEGAPDGADVVAIAADGKKTVVASGFEQPIGIAQGPGKTLFVSDYKANKIKQIDGAGAVTDFVAKIDTPVQLAVEPFAPQDGAPFVLIASAKPGVVRFDGAGKIQGSPAGLKLATGVATVPSNEIAAIPPVVTPSSVAGTSTTATTRLRPTTTRATVPVPDTPTTSSNVLALSLGVLGALVVVVVAFAILHKPKSSANAGFEERPLDANSVAEAFGPCAAEEVEVAEAEGGRQSLIVQLEAAEKRAAEAVVRGREARAGVAEARQQRMAAITERKARPKDPSAPALPQLRVDDLGLTTDAGRLALRSFVQKEIDSQTLEEQWTELGEHQAVDAVRDLAERRAALDPTHAAEQGAIKAERRARNELQVAEGDAEHAANEIERLKEREAIAIARIETAQQALDECHAAHDAEQAARAAKVKAEAVAAAEAKAAVAPPTTPAPIAPATTSATPAAAPADASSPATDPDPTDATLFGAARRAVDDGDPAPESPPELAPPSAAGDPLSLRDLAQRAREGRGSAAQDGATTEVPPAAPASPPVASDGPSSTGSSDAPGPPDAPAGPNFA